MDNKFLQCRIIKVWNIKVFHFSKICEQTFGDRVKTRKQKFLQ